MVYGYPIRREERRVHQTPQTQFNKSHMQKKRLEEVSKQNCSARNSPELLNYEDGISMGFLELYIQIDIVEKI